MKIITTLSIFILAFCFHLSNNAQISVSLTSDSVTCYGSSDGSVTATVTNGNPNYKYIWSNELVITDDSLATNTISSLPIGTYTVIVIDANSDSDTASIIISQPPRMQITNFVRENNTCFGYSYGKAGVAVSGGTGNIHYNWSTNDTTSLIDSLSSGYYSISITDDNNCALDIAFNIFDPENIIITKEYNICDGDSLLINGTYYKTSSVDTSVFKNINGCDSTVISILSISKLYNIGKNINICSGDSIFIDSTYFSESGTHILTFNSSKGCDSIITITLTVEDPISITKNVSICEGESYNIGGSYKTISGTYYDTTSSNYGCDSITILNLSVILPYAGNETVNICNGDSILIGNKYRDTTGVYIDSLANIYSCDSIVTVNLILNFPTTVENTVNICQGDSILIGSKYKSVAGTYSNSYLGINSCDSVVNTNLIVNPISNISVQKAICTGDSILLEGIYRTASGIYTDTISSTLSCDSIISTNLTVDTIIMNNRNIPVCNGDSLFAEGSYQKQAGTYYDTTSSAYGCDSIAITNLSINPIYSFSMTRFLCGGDSAVIFDQYKSESGTYEKTYISSNNCDSTMSIILTIDNIYDIWDTIDICKGDSALINNAYYDTSNTYTNHYFTKAGCDSVVNSVLIIHQHYDLDFDINLCDGDSIYLEGAYRNTPGAFNETNTSIFGCDSLVSVNLDVKPKYASNTDITICGGDSISASGSYKKTTGVYDDVYSSLYNCDSIITISLTVNPTYVFENTIEICDGDSTLINGEYRKTSNTYTETYSTYLSCDSLYRITLDVHPTINTNIEVQICSGDSMFIEGAYRKTTGKFTEIYTSSNNCDSNLITSLIVTDTLKYIYNISICEGDSFYAEGKYQKTSGIYYDHTPSSFGCDSFITTNIIVNAKYETTVDAKICENDSIKLGGVYQSTAGVYYDNYSSINGCDSIIKTTLSIKPIYNTVINKSICENDSLLLEGSYRKTAGTYYDYYSSKLGCDSTIKTILSITSLSIADTSIRICKGDSILFDNKYYSTEGDHDIIFTSFTGCDSILTLTLNVNEPYLSGKALDTTICQKVIDFNLFGLLDGDYTANGIWTDEFNTGALKDSLFNPTLIGNNKVKYTVAGDSICNGSSTTIDIIVSLCIGIDENNKNTTFKIYPNPASTSIDILLNGYQGLKGIIEISQIDGKLILSKNIEINSEKSIENINVFDMPQGIYLIHFKSNEFVKTRKLIINR